MKVIFLHKFANKKKENQYLEASKIKGYKINKSRSKVSPLSDFIIKIVLAHGI